MIGFSNTWALGTEKIIANFFSVIRYCFPVTVKVISQLPIYDDSYS